MSPPCTKRLWFVAALAGCAADEPTEPCRPGLLHPGSVMVTEGESVSFEVSLAEPIDCPAHITPFVDPSMGVPDDKLTVQPRSLTLDETYPRMFVTVAAVADADSVNEEVRLELYLAGRIAGESPRILILIQDAGP